MSNPCPHNWERLAIVGGWSAAGMVQMHCDCGAYLDFDINDAKWVSDPTMTIRDTPIEEQQASWDRKNLSKEHFGQKAMKFYKRRPVGV